MGTAQDLGFLNASVYGNAFVLSLTRKSNIKLLYYHFLLPFDKKTGTRNLFDVAELSMYPLF